jgi:hypothetical protein
MSLLLFFCAAMYKGYIAFKIGGVILLLSFLFAPRQLACKRKKKAGLFVASPYNRI